MNRDILMNGASQGPPDQGTKTDLITRFTRNDSQHTILIFADL